MSGRVRMTAVSAVVGSLGLTGAVLLVTAPMTAPRANAAQVTVVNPTQIEPTDPTITDSPSAAPEPTVTVTITESPDPTVTRTTTVTPKPSKKPKSTKTPDPAATKTSPVVPPASLPTPTSMPAIPSNPPIVPTTTQAPVDSVAPEPQVSLALVTPTPTETSGPSPSFADPTPDSVPIEIRNASPEYDQLTLSRKLAIPGVLLAVLVMLGVLIFEGRIRRMAHAAAIRKAGPRSAGRHRGDDLPGGGLPMPGYPVYHGGTAYAPIISFVPVQGYPNVPGPGSPFPHDPQGYGAVYEQGVALPAGPSEPWPRQDEHEHPGYASDATLTFPLAGQQPPPADPMAGPAQTGQPPTPTADKPRRGLLGRFRRDPS
ncbi:MAG: hypothetical protein JWQ95_2657 [Sphaerisporangium sp.]|nr:hypothetical protein [Sphaerisporangium sp.]